MDDSTVKLELPSGGWATFRSTITYGARMKLNRLSARLGASASVGRDSTEATFSLAADEIADAAVLQDYYPLIYLLKEWSFELPLPTLENYTSLEELPYKDGEVLVAKAAKAFEGNGTVDFSPNIDPKEAPRTTLSGASSNTSEGNPLTSDTVSPWS